MPLLLAVKLYVIITLGTANSVCADNPRTHREFSTQHKHEVLFARINGTPESGDLLVVNIGTNQLSFLAAHGTVEVDFPAGLGIHDITVDWMDAGGQRKATASTSLHVYPWEACEPQK